MIKYCFLFSRLALEQLVFLMKVISASLSAAASPGNVRWYHKDEKRLNVSTASLAELRKGSVLCTTLSLLAESTF